MDLPKQKSADRPSRALVIALMIIAWFSISASSILVVKSGEPAPVCAFWRLIFSVAILSVLGTASSGLRASRLDKRAFMLSVLSGIFLAAHFLAWMTSLFMISIALSTTLVVTYPAISAVIEHFIKGIRISVKEIIGLSVALAGVAVALSPTLLMGESSIVGAGLAIAGAFFAAAYFSIGRILRGAGTALTNYAVIAYGSASATLLLYSIVTNTNLLPGSTEAWPYLIALALVPMIGGHTVMNYLLKHLPTHVVTSIALGEPAGASLLAALIIAQIPEAVVIAGMGLTVVGIWLATSSSLSGGKHAKAAE